MTKRARVLLVLLVVAAGYGVHRRLEQRRADPSGRLTLYGNVDIRTAQLAFDGEALVSTMAVEEGARVAQGDVLATLDATRVKAELEEAEGQAAAQAAAVRRLEAGTRQQDVEQVRARVASVEARLANATQAVRRLTQTANSGASSQQQLEDAQASLSVEQAALNEAQQALALAVEGPRREDLEEARAQLDAGHAHVRVLQDRLADTELRAPCAGVIESRLLEPGEYATRGRAVYTLAVTAPKWVRTYVPEPSLGKVRPGARAEVHSDSFPGKAFEGWVGFISPVAEFTPKSVETADLRTQLVYEVRVHVKDPEDQLRLGMPVTVTVDEGSPAGVQP